MIEFAKSYTDSRTGISYKLIGDYYLPDLIVSDVNPVTIGRFGRERLQLNQQRNRLIHLRVELHPR